MIARILPFTFTLMLAVSFLACKKEEVQPSLQQQLNEGESIMSLLEDYPLDSFYTKSYAGGYIFYLEANGTGIVAGKSDLNSNAPWGCSSMSIGSGTGSAIGTGQANTDSIVANCPDTLSAAYFCNSSNAAGYSDWYLPSEKELEMMYLRLQQKGVGNFANNYYWTSTPVSSNTAQHVLFTNGDVSFSTKSNLHYVRAARNF